MRWNLSARPADVTVSRLGRLRRAALDAATIHSALALFDQAIVSGTSFLASVAVGRLAGETELGVYAIAVSLALLFVAVQDSLVAVPYTFLRERGEGVRAYAGSVLVHHGSLAAAAAVLLALVAAVAAAMGSGRVAGTAAALAVVVPGVLVHELSRRLAFAHHQVRAALVTDAAAAAIQIAALAALALTGRLTATTALLALGGGRGLAGAARLAVARSSFDLGAGDWGGTFRRHWRFARFDLAAQVVGVVEGYAAYWILTLVQGPGATGVLAAATSVAMMANPILFGLHNVFVPRIADAQEKGAGEIWRVAGRTSFVYVALMGAFALFLIAFGGPILTFLYGAGFSGGGAVVAIMATVMVVGASELAAANGLRAFDRPDLHLAAGGAGLATIVLVGPPLCLAWGAVGAALAALAGGVVEAGVDWGCLGRLRRRAAGDREGRG